MAICPLPASREQEALLLLPHLDFLELSFPKPDDLARVAAPEDLGTRGLDTTGWMQSRYQDTVPCPATDKDLSDNPGICLSAI